MIGKRCLPPAAAGKIVRIGGIALQNGQFLRTHALDCVGVEARARERKTQQAESLVAIFIQDTQRAVKIVAPHLEAEFDGVVFEALVKDLAVEVTRTLVEQISGEMCGARL